MPSDPGFNPLSYSRPGAEVRRVGRLRCNMLNCTFGEVADLSAAGMRVRHRGALKVNVGDETPLTLSFAGSEVALRTRVVWLRRTGFRRHEIGFEFLDLSAQGRECVTEIARCATKLAGFRPEAA